MKALVKESTSPRGRFGDTPEDGEFDWETPVLPEPDGTDAAVQAIADTPLQETITASLKVVRKHHKSMKRKRAVASFRRAKRRAVLAVTGTDGGAAAGVALAATDADGGAAAGGASAATDAAGGAAASDPPASEQT